MKKGVILFLILFSFIFVSGVYGLSSNIIDYGITEEDSSTSLCFPGGLQSCSIYNYASNTQLLIGDSVGDDMDDLIINLEYHPQDNPSSSCFNSIGSNSGAVEQVRIKYPISSGVECNVLLTNNGGRVCCPVLYVLSVTKSGSGTITSNPSGINCGTTCSASYASGTSVTLTATPASGYYLSAWGGCDSTSGNTCTVSMTGAKSVSVNFAQTTTSYFLSVDKYIGNNKNGIGGAVTSTSNPTQTNQINMPSSSTLTGMSVSYNSGTSVTLTATASSGYVFSGWSGCTSTSENVCTVSITSTKYVNATFNVAPPNNYQLSVTKSGSGTGSVVSDSGGINCGTTCSASYQANTLVKLTATAASGSSFAGWSDPACSRIDPCYVTMNQAKTIIATFTLNPPTCVDKDGDGYFSTSTTCSKYENPVCDLDSISDVTAENGIKCDLLKIELCHTKIVNFQIVESTCIKKLANGDICNIVNGDCIKTDGTSYNNGQGCPAQQTTVNIDSSTKVENYALTSDIINANVYCQSPLNDICQRDNNFNGIWDYAACSFCKNPGRTEICDNIDNNCDGTIDNNCVKNCVDRDGDGYNSSMSGGSVYSLSKCGKMDCKDNSANDPAVCANIGTDLAPKSSACTSLTYAECSYCINPGRTRQVCGVDAKCAGWEFNNGVLRQVTNTALLPQGYVKNSVNEWVFNGYSISSGNWMVCADDGQCVISGEYLASQPQENLGTTQTAERYHYEQIKFIPGGVMSSTGRYGEDWWSPSAKTTGAGKDAQCHYTNMDVVRISASGKDSLESLYGYDCLFPVNNGVYYLCVKQWQSSPFNSISCMPTAEDKPTNGIGTSINSRYGEFGIDGFNQFISQARVKAIVANSSSSWRWSESCVKKDKCKDGANNYGLTNLWDVPYVSENVEKMSVEFKDKVKTSADSTFLVRLRDMDVPGSCRANCVDQDKDQFCANSKMFPDCVDTSVFSTRDPSLYEAQKAIISKKCSDVSEIDFLKEGAPSLKDIFGCWAYSTITNGLCTSSELNKLRPLPISVENGALAYNTNEAYPGFFQKTLNVWEIAEKEYIREKMRASPADYCVVHPRKKALDSPIAGGDIHPFSSFGEKVDICLLGMDTNCNKNGAEGWDFNQLRLGSSEDVKTPFDSDLKTGIELYLKHGWTYTPSLTGGTPGSLTYVEETDQICNLGPTCLQAFRDTFPGIKGLAVMAGIAVVGMIPGVGQVLGMGLFIGTFPFFALSTAEAGAFAVKDKSCNALATFTGDAINFGTMFFGINHGTGGAKTKSAETAAACKTGVCAETEAVPKAKTPTKTGTGGCFLAGTKILMADGSEKNIEDLKEGEMVVAYDIENSKTENVPITETFARNASSYRIIKYEIEK